MITTVLVLMRYVKLHYICHTKSQRHVDSSSCYCF